MFICEKNYECCNYRYWDTEEDIEDDARECGHLIEVERVVHAHWIDEWVCSHCGEICPIRVCGNPLKVCINCGAKMDEVDNK